MKIIRAIVLIAVGAISGCSKHVAPSVEALLPCSSGRIVSAQPGKEVDIADLMPYLQRASWTNDWCQWKISTDVALADGKKIRFELLAPMFRIEGVEGTFFIRQEDVEDYKVMRTRILGR